MKRAMALELAVVELALEPGAIGQHFPALAIDAVMMEFALVARTVRPCQLALALTDAILPVTNILNAVRPLDPATSVHSVLQPLTRVNPAFFGALEGPLTLLHAVFELAGISVAIGPCPCALPMEDALPQGAYVLLPGRPRHSSFTPHHVLAPLAVICPPGGPRLFAVTPHVALVEMARVVAAITPNVMTLAVHSAIEPTANVGVTIGEDALVLCEFVCRDAPGIVQFAWSGRSLVNACVPLRDHVLNV
mmetsp:Transcript_12749/g.24978  ORF Transcript_12749/g.24978 Transcript_12749/m.24978 type:complete len:249 (-) Transcript_12749:198-944(-)